MSGGRVSVLPMWLMVGGLLIALGVIWQRSDPARTPAAQFWPWPLAFGIATVLAVPALWLAGRDSSARTVNRRSRQTNRSGGVASRWDLWRTSSASAMRRQACVVRPAMASLGRWERRLLPVTQFATCVARVGRARVWSSAEEVTVRIGGPRTGKTGELCGRIIEAPGAVIATSTRTDLFEHTWSLRADLGPIHVFNPSAVGGLRSSVSFDPLIGCTNPAAAMFRAQDLLAHSSVGADRGDQVIWDDLARGALATLLHAAALGQRSMHDVLGWVANPRAAGKDVQGYLRQSIEAVSWERRATQFLDTNDRTQSSICATIMPALQWLADPTAAASLTGGEPLDVTQLLESRGTVYLLGAEEAHTAPLVTALTAHIARESRRLAAHSPNGRLDPPLTLCLDEAALICPVPLDSWTADMGGRGVTLHIAAQSRAQLRQRWGDAGAGAILNNAAVLMILGGLRDRDDLGAFSALAGTRLEQVPHVGMHGEITGYASHRVPVMSEADISQLRTGQVMIARRGMPIALGRLQMVWDRRDYKRSRRQLAQAKAAYERPTDRPARPQWQGRPATVVDGELLDVHDIPAPRRPDERVWPTNGHVR